MIDKLPGIVVESDEIKPRAPNRVSPHNVGAQMVSPDELASDEVHHGGGVGPGIIQELADGPGQKPQDDRVCALLR